MLGGNITQGQDTILALLTQTNLTLPQSLQHIVDSVTYGDGPDSTPRQYGCDDPFAIFGFLAFLLALLQLLVDSGDGRRRRRSAGRCQVNKEQEISSDLREASLAVYTLIQGFLNTMDLSEGTQIDILQHDF